jgi:DNA-binding CsgD family transcriptional regulator
VSAPAVADAPHLPAADGAGHRPMAAVSRRADPSHAGILVHPAGGHGTGGVGARLLAQALESVAALVPCALVVAFGVEESGAPAPRMSLRGPQAGSGDAARMLASVAALEPIDPFSPRRATALRAALLSAADVGGVHRVEQSLYGAHLHRHGFGVPAVLYFRRGGAIDAGVTVLPAAGASLDAVAVRFLRELHPLIEQALRLAPEPALSTAADRLAAQAGLTGREAQVALLVADGATNAAIARALSVSQATVKTHLNKIYGKLGVRSRTQLAVLCGAAAPRA